MIQISLPYWTIREWTNPEQSGAFANDLRFERLYRLFNMNVKDKVKRIL